MHLSTQSNLVTSVTVILAILIQLNPRASYCKKYPVSVMILKQETVSDLFDYDQFKRHDTISFSACNVALHTALVFTVSTL